MIGNSLRDCRYSTLTSSTRRPSHAGVFFRFDTNAEVVYFDRS